MARMISPEAYGLVAMAYVVIHFGSHFSELGFGPALIQKQDIKPQDIGTAYFTAFGTGILFFVVGYLIAPTAAVFFAEPELVAILRVASAIFLLGPITAISINLLRRALRFKVTSGIEIAGFALGTGLVGISLAILGYGVWSLIAAALGNSLIRFILSLVAVRHEFHLSFDKNSFRTLFAFGGKYSLTGFFEVITYRVDTIFIAYFLNSTLVGIYNRASFLVQIPTQYLWNVVNRVIFPSLSEARTEPNRLMAGYRSAFLFLGIILFPFCIGISIGAREIVLVILGPQWHDAVPILRILAVGVPFHLLLHLNGILYDVKNKLTLKLTIRFCHLVFICLLYYIMRGYGLAGFAIAFMVTEIVFYFIYTFCMFLFIDPDWRKMVARHVTIFWITLVTGGAVGAAVLMGHLIGAPDIAVLAIEMLAGATALVVCTVIFPPRLVRADISNRFGGGELQLAENGIIGRGLHWYLSRLVAKDRDRPW